MLEVGWSELLVVALILIIVVGPKDLPGMLRTFGRMTGRLRTMANEFKGQFDQALREAELDDVRKGLNEVNKLNPANSLKDAINPIRKLGDEIRSDLKKATDTVNASVAEPAVSTVEPPSALASSAATGTAADASSSTSASAETAATSTVETASSTDAASTTVAATTAAEPAADTTKPTPAATAETATVKPAAEKPAVSTVSEEVAVPKPEPRKKSVSKKAAAAAAAATEAEAVAEAETKPKRAARKKPVNTSDA